MSQPPHAPRHKPHREWAICHGSVRDHRGSVEIRPIPDFDLDQTIFGSIKGTLERRMTSRRLGQSVHWKPEIRQEIEQDFERLRQAHPPAPVDEELLRFLSERCNFNAEHADGSFWEHLYFGYEYSLHHFPQHSARVMLLHSILGTGTNTFAMKAELIPELRKHLTPFEWRHIEAFPSVLRLLYQNTLIPAMAQSQCDLITGLRCHRVIDNAPIELSAQDLYIQLNYQLMHLVDFMPIANWYTQKSDPSHLLFRSLYSLLESQGRIECNLGFDPELAYAPSLGAQRPWKDRWMDHVPSSLVRRFGARAIERFSAAIGHSLAFTLMREP